jgi:hypothetical protein
MATPRLSDGAVLLLAQFVRTYDEGSVCLILGDKWVLGLLSNYKTLSRARILASDGLLEVMAHRPGKNAYKVTPRGLAVHDRLQLRAKLL